MTHKQTSKQRVKVWNFNDKKGWGKFRELTQVPTSFRNYAWKNGDHPEIYYQRWRVGLDSILQKCFKKKRLRNNGEPIYNKQIRNLIKERKILKKRLTRETDNSPTHRNITYNILKLDKLIDNRIADFNYLLVKQTVGNDGTISKQNFWKMKRIIAPKSIEIPHSVLDKAGNHITDPNNIMTAYCNEFQHRLRKRNIKDELKQYEAIQNNLCKIRLIACQDNCSPDFTLTEVRQAVSELKSGKCVDPMGYIREVFINSGDGLLLYLLDMINVIKKSKIIPLEWSEMWIKTLKKKKGSYKTLSNYRGIFIVPIISVIFEKLIKNRIMDTLQGTMSHFQNGGMRGKGVVDNLFILRGIIDHAIYLGKQLWITFYDIEKCFDSLWLEDCVNSLWENGIKNDLLSLIYFLNTKAQIVVKTPFGQCEPFVCSNVVRQGTVLGPVLNNCSIDKFSKESYPYFYGKNEIKSLEFVDDIADINDQHPAALLSNKIIQNVQDQRRLTFSAEKCEMLKINPTKTDSQASISINGETVKSVSCARYLGDHFNVKGDNQKLCAEQCSRAKGTIIELMAICREVVFGRRQIEVMLLLYRSVFLPRLLYNCEAWSNLSKNDIKSLQASQLSYLRCVMEVPKSTPVAALYLELGILPVKYEIEIKQLLFLKRILDKEANDPVLLSYQEMLKFGSEANWANNILGLRQAYNLPLNDANIKCMDHRYWKSLVKSTINQVAFSKLVETCSTCGKTSHLTYSRLKTSKYLHELDPQHARVIFRAKVRILDLKINFKKKYAQDLLCPFCRHDQETFEHVFSCNVGLWCNNSLRGMTLTSLSNEASIQSLRSIAQFLTKYLKYRSEML